MNKSNEIFANVHSIETLGAFDGPGIRYVLFLQGCPFKCQFCHNRDTWSTRLNKKMTVEEVLKDYDQYKSFYKKGGITVSGGEPLLQTPFLIELFKSAKLKGIHTCLDTSAACFNVRKLALFQELMQYTDLVLLDIKHIDNEKHKVLVGDSNVKVLDFAKYLDELKVKVRIRHVLIPTINDSVEDLANLRLFIDQLKNVVGIDVLPYHTKGKVKWERMGLVYPLAHIKEPTKDIVDRAERILKENYQYTS